MSAVHGIVNERNLRLPSAINIVVAAGARARVVSRARILDGCDDSSHIAPVLRFEAVPANTPLSVTAVGIGAASVALAPLRFDKPETFCVPLVGAYDSAIAGSMGVKVTIEKKSASSIANPRSSDFDESRLAPLPELTANNVPDDRNLIVVSDAGLSQRAYLSSQIDKARKIASMDEIPDPPAIPAISLIESSAEDKLHGVVSHGAIAGGSQSAKATPTTFSPMAAITESLQQSAPAVLKTPPSEATSLSGTAMPTRLIDYFGVMVTAASTKGKESYHSTGRDNETDADEDAGMNSDDSGPSTHSSSPQRDAVLQFRRPKKDHADVSLPSNLSWFFFPDGIRPLVLDMSGDTSRSTERPATRSSSFVLTNDTGQKNYCVCLTAFRLEREAASVSTTREAWWPVVLFMLTRLPIVPQLQRILQRVYDVSFSLTNPPFLFSASVTLLTLQHFFFFFPA